MSTSILCFEDVRRTRRSNTLLQVICIPEDSFNSGIGICNFSSIMAMNQYPILPQYLAKHKIDRKDLEAWGFRFREVVLDRRALRAGLLREYVIEWKPGTELLQHLQQICQDTTNVMHYDSLEFFIAEHSCRSIIEREVRKALQAHHRAPYMFLNNRC